MRRRTFWLWTLALVLLLVLMLGAFAPYMSTTGGSGSWRVNVAIVAVVFVAIYARVLAARLQDMRLSPWWTLPVGLLLVAIPILMMAESFAVYRRIEPTYAAQQAVVPYVLFMEIGAAVLFFGGWIVLGLIRGTAGPNRFGPDPIEKNRPSDELGAPQ